MKFSMKYFMKFYITGFVSLKDFVKLIMAIYKAYSIFSFTGYKKS